jgi:hypothetical protein
VEFGVWHCESLGCCGLFAILNIPDKFSWTKNESSCFFLFERKDLRCCSEEPDSVRGFGQTKAYNMPS